VAAKKRPSKVRPKTPSRVKKRTRKPKGHHHPELIGLGLAAFGLFMGSVLYAGWNGGYVGKAIGDGLVALIGGTAYVLPIACAAVGSLMVARSDLPRFAPFRTGLGLVALALALVLGRAHGGYLGQGLESLFGRAIGSTGTHILGVFVLLAGALLVTGASAGAFLRRSGHAVRRAASARPTRRTAQPEQAPLPSSFDNVVPLPVAPIDGVEEFPDVVAGGPPPLIMERDEPDEGLQSEPIEQASLFDVTEGDEDTVYTLPDRDILRRSKQAATGAAERGAHVSGTLVQALANFGVDATVIGEIAGPRVTRYELQLAPGTKVSKVAGLKDDLAYALATTEIRILAPIPG
jgi:S-DNA-T family DNA segregation ATPase FtsK/SpoIIIE